MCGITGILKFDGASAPVDGALLDRMRETLAHRGPNGAGSWVSSDGKVGLGHRRLSIIDLTEAASQPMSNEDGSIWISFNGEIYNHVEIRAELEALGGHTWKTNHSDTEVILHAFEQWGIECLHRFRGMFAFALWDGRARELWLVRDRIGVKPLYYSVGKDQIAFGSEIKALLADPAQPRRLDEDSLFYYLSFLTVPAPNTLFSGIHKLRAGSWLRVRSDGTVTERRYWDALDRFAPMTNMSEGQIAERLLSELRTAVQLRRVSDVPVGAFLSGGIDSSTNVALLSEGGKSVIKTFTVGFKGQTTYQNETEEARRVATLFHAQHHEELLSVDDLIDFLPKMVYLQDEPIADPVCVPLYYLARLARRNGVTVCQVGEGSDELFWGYPSWKTLRSLQRLGNIPLPRIVKTGVLHTLEAVGRATSREYEYLRRNCEGFPVFWSGAEAFTDREKLSVLAPRLRTRYARASGWDVLAPIRARFEEQVRDGGTVNWMTYSDLSVRLPELLLMRVDKMSMGEAVEGRVPFLDHRLVEFAVNIPESIKTRRDNPKYILKRAVRGLIPDDVIHRPKQGFGVPVQEWIFQRLGTHARAAIEEMVAATDLFDAQEVRRLLEHGKGSRIWFLFNLALWWKRFIA
jgi:asparagine synthase (glutamine-hydrolysing)